MKQDIIYIGELDADIDDVIAAEYLYHIGALRMVVCDPVVKTPEGRQRMKQLQAMGIQVGKKLPKDARHVFVGGALTETARFLTAGGRLESLVMNGGFVGGTLAKNPLPKFKGKAAVRTFNFNVDVGAAERVLKPPAIGRIILTGKNVCHDPRNTLEQLWVGKFPWMAKYRVRPKKCMHDLLACREGLIRLGYLKEPPYCSYRVLYPFHNGLDDSMTLWGSTDKENGFHPVEAAIGWEGEK